MALGLVLIFVGLPILEIALFIKVGGAIGLLPTLGIILATGIFGAAIMRWQGLRALDRLRASMETGADPVGPLAHGALILVAGVLLLLPGFFTDALGILLLVPPLRALLIRWGASRATVEAATYVRRPGGAPGARPGRPETIEAEYEVVEPRPGARGDGRGGSGWTRPH
jgi:UPF0716 protein FxsA